MGECLTCGFLIAVKRSYERFHAVVTLSLSKIPKSAEVAKVYLFSERDTKVSLVLTKEYDGFPRVLLDDVNLDGKPELVVEYVEDTGKAGDIDMWRISATDALSKIELPDDTEYLTASRTYFRRLEPPYYGPGVYGLIATASILKGGEPIERRIRFRWDEKTNSYQLTDVVDVSQTETKVRSR